MAEELCATCGSAADATVHKVKTYQRVPGGYGHPFLRPAAPDGEPTISATQSVITKCSADTTTTIDLSGVQDHRDNAQIVGGGASAPDPKPEPWCKIHNGPMFKDRQGNILCKFCVEDTDKAIRAARTEPREAMSAEGRPQDCLNCGKELAGSRLRDYCSVPCAEDHEPFMSAEEFSKGYHDKYPTWPFQVTWEYTCRFAEAYLQAYLEHRRLKS